jgi:hypothetical protein
MQSTVASSRHTISDNQDSLNRGIGLRGTRFGTFFLRRRQESQPARLRVVLAINPSGDLPEMGHSASWRNNYLQQQD